MHAVQLRGAESAVDRRADDPGRQKLHPRDDTVLLGGDEPNRSGFSSVSEGNPNWFGHAAMVGALAVPAQRRFAPTQPKNRRRSPRGSTTRPGTVVIRLK
jgi:hypothetical protein